MIESLIEKLEKGGKPAMVGETRNFGGTDYKKMGDGNWVRVEHKEETKLKEMESQKEKTPRQNLEAKLEAKTQISVPQKHLNDLENSPVVENKQTRSGKPMFTQVEGALANGYTPEDFREVGNMFYDRAQKTAEMVKRMEDAGQTPDPAFAKIQKLNAKMGKLFIAQASHIEDRNKKTAKMTKSIVMLGHADSAEINTASAAVELKVGLEDSLLKRLYSMMDGYEYGETPRMIVLDAGHLYLVKVEEGLYTGAFKRITPVQDGALIDNEKVRLERMTLPALAQFCIVKDWYRPEALKPAPIQLEPVPSVEPLIAKLEAPTIESDLDKKIRMLTLIDKLLN